MERSVEIVTCLSLGIVGLSHVLQPQAWARYFIELRGRGETGVWVVAFLHLPLGLVILGFHRVWSGLPLLVTLLGCAWTFKATLYFCFPAAGLRSMSLVSLERAHYFRAAGAVLLALAGVVSYSIRTSVPPVP